MAKFNVLNPTTPLDSEFRVRKALECGPPAAFIIAGIHALGAVLFLAKGASPTIWLPHAVGVLLAVALGFVIRRHPSPWLAGTILAWAGLEAFLTSLRLLPICLLIGVLAYQALRGAFAYRRLQSSADVF